MTPVTPCSADLLRVAGSNLSTLAVKPKGFGSSRGLLGMRIDFESSFFAGLEPRKSPMSITVA
jgi:hypothetical protein